MPSNRPIAIVTGAYGGMGRACARRLGLRADLVLCDLHADRLGSLAESLSEEGYTIVATIAGDLSEPGLAEQVVQTARAAGRLQAVAHTAGVSPSLGTWDVILKANIIAQERLLVAIEAALEPGLAVSLIGSMGSHITPRRPEIEALLDNPLEPDFLTRIQPLLEALAVPGDERGASSPAYGASKRATVRLCELRALAWGKSGARIVSVSPGLIATPMGRTEMAGNPGASAVVSGTPLGRLGTALDIADAVDFLTSDRASFITGTDLRVDGGAVPALRGPGF